MRSYEDAVERLGNLDGAMIAQSAIGNPWVLTPHLPSTQERQQVISTHLNLAIAADLYFQEAVAQMQETLTMPTLDQLQSIAAEVQKNPQLAQGSHIPTEFRKYLFAYLNGLPKNKQLKLAIAQTKEYADLVSLLD
ncbi:MAG: hypothetical protein H6765_07790 [Candidatus Peribacteria bacterium]|nr:MAG: hypothetical protein H6765_07790 [Candidatus Peribacteria bacterium]